MLMNMPVGRRVLHHTKADGIAIDRCHVETLPGVGHADLKAVEVARKGPAHDLSPACWGDGPIAPGIVDTSASRACGRHGRASANTNCTRPATNPVATISR